MRDELGLGRDPGERRRLDREVERRREADRADHSQGVLSEALLGLADGAKQPRLEVRSTAMRIDERG